MTHLIQKNPNNLSSAQPSKVSHTRNCNLPQPYLSVVIPAYNEESTVEQVVRSVFEVPLVGEVIVVDDCSGDATSVGSASPSSSSSTLRCSFGEPFFGDRRCVSTLVRSLSDFPSVLSRVEFFVQGGIFFCRLRKRIPSSRESSIERKSQSWSDLLPKRCSRAASKAERERTTNENDWKESTGYERFRSRVRCGALEVERAESCRGSRKTCDDKQKKKKKKKIVVVTTASYFRYCVARCRKRLSSSSKEYCATISQLGTKSVV